MKASRIDEIATCVERNFEKLSLLNVILSDVGEIFIRFLELISVVMVIVFFLVYVFFSERDFNMFFALVASYIALVALIVTTTDIRERLLEEVELLHNLKKIQKLYLNDNLFDKEYPIIKSLLMIKQKHPKISLLQLRQLDKNIFTADALLSFLYDIKLENHTKVLSGNKEKNTGGR